jgi:outer membrane protein assembly factor BamB
LTGTILAVKFVLLMAPMALAIPDRDPQPSRDWPMFGGTTQRNMVNLVDKNLPAIWSVEEGKRKNIKWSAALGQTTRGSPIVANGKVYVATDGREDDEAKTKCAVLMAFREADGKLLWQNKHRHLHGQVPSAGQGLPSTPSVDGNCIYYLISGCEAICADCDTGKILWRLDLVKTLGVHPAVDFCQAPPLAAPLVVGDLVFVATGNGMNAKCKVVAPNAPSFVALNKKTGAVVWQSNLPGKNIIVGGWSSPAFANVNNRPQVIFAGGDGVIYSFVPETGKLLWKCDCLPVRAGNANSFVATPVIVGDRLYIGQGLPEYTLATPKWSYFLCLDITKKGDVSLKSHNANDKANKDSALVWAFGGPVVPAPAKGRRAELGPTESTAAVHDGLIYLPETYGYLHCLDAKTGREIWNHDLQCAVMGSPYCVDGRVFVGTDDGDVVVFQHGRTRNVLATIDVDGLIRSAPVAANGVLYVMTHKRLYAIARDK